VSAALRRAAPVRGEVDVPGGLLLHPVVLAAIALFIVNDHVLKPAHHSFVTGKLSDVAGLIFFPVLVAAIIEFAAPGLRRHAGLLLIIAACMTGLTFIVMLTTPAGADGYRWFFGLVQWPFRTAAALVSGVPVPAIAPVTFAADPTDLITLPALFVPLALAVREHRLRHRA
jgi:hypothetical protein